MISLAVLGVTASAQAQSIIQFDPTGGTQANSTLNVSSFAYLPGNVLAVGGGSLTPADQPPPAGTTPGGKDITVLFQAILGSINTAGGNSASLNSNNGNITVDGNAASGIQIVAVAEFHERLQTFGTTTTFIPAPNFGPAGQNFFTLFAQPAANANINDPNSTNQYPGAGATQILTGHFVNPNNTFTSSFTNSGVANQPLNQHVGGSGDYAGVNTIIGSGNTGGLMVQVDSYLTSYFKTMPLVPLIGLNLTQVSSVTPFTSVDPALKMFTGLAPNIGAVNSGGADFLIQTQATNNFQALPEPGQVSMALVAGALFGARCLWRRRRKVAAV
jgi:hypothetical protein